jgi:hypothetical protein
MSLPYCSRIKIPITTCAKGPKMELPIYSAEAVKPKPHCRQFVKISGHKGSRLDLPLRDLLYTPL